MSGEQDYWDRVLDFRLMSFWEKNLLPDEDASFQEALAQVAKSNGMTVSEYRSLMEKWAEFDEMLTEFMQAAGFEVSDMYSVVGLSQVAQQKVQASHAWRSMAGETTAQIKKAKRAEAAQNAARLWDSLKTIPKHNRASVIAKRMGVSEPTARSYLRETGRKTKRR